MTLNTHCNTALSFQTGCSTSYDGPEMLGSEGTHMTETVFTPERRGIAAWYGDALAGAKDMARAGLSEAMTWDLYKWTVLALMTATFILVALSYGGIRSELAVLKQERANASASVPDQ